METVSAWRRYLAPLNFAALATWGAVLIEKWQSVRGAGFVIGLPARALALALLLCVFGGFLLAVRDGDRPLANRAPWGLAAMLIAIFALLFLYPANTTPALLVIVASVAAARLAPRTAIVLLFGANLLLYFAMTRVQREQQPLLMLAIYAGFQTFAAFASHALQRARETAEEMRAVNAHMLATRSLLAETTRDSERLRLSRELHDVSGHKLTALKINLALMERNAAMPVTAELANARQLTDELLADLRGVVSQLRRFDGIDLRTAFEQLAAPFPVPQVHIDVERNVRVDDAAQAEALIGVAQESLTNAARHAHAAHVWLRLSGSAAEFELSIEDDGRAAASLQEGHGITGMRERIEQLGGAFAVGRAARGGTRVRAQLPRRAAP